MVIPVIGLGAGGHAKVVLDILAQDGRYQAIGLLDPNEELWGTKLCGVPVLGPDEKLPKLLGKGVRHFFVGLGTTRDVQPRLRLFDYAVNTGLQPVSAIHNTAVVSPHAVIGSGATVMPLAVINAGAKLGCDVIVNTGAIVEHDCLLEDHVHIATGARLGSTVWVQANSHIGVGASVRQGIKIGRNSVVGAGAVVVKEVPSDVIVAGVPARVLRHIRQPNGVVAQGGQQSMARLIL